MKEITNEYLREFVYGDEYATAIYAGKFDKVEEALDFKLFRWQKEFIEHGYTRRTGKTTAEILRLLLTNIDSPPFDLDNVVGFKTLNQKKIFIEQTIEIYMKLQAAGVKTRKITYKTFKSKKGDK